MPKEVLTELILGHLKSFNPRYGLLERKPEAEPAGREQMN